MRTRSAGLPDPVIRAFDCLFDRRPTRHEARATAHRLRGGSTVGTVLMQLAHSPEFFEHRSVDLAKRGPEDIDEYVDFLYATVLQRPPDPSGREHFRSLLRDGAGRDAVAEKLVASDEHVNRVVRELYPLPDLRAMAPGRFRDVPMIDGSGTAPCFVADHDDDFTWIERAILDHDYYDRPGIWGSTVDDDKRRVASLLADLAPTRLLDVGCANGAVIQCLLDNGVDAYGIELSESAVERALPGARGRIRVGDIATLDLDDRFDVIAGLDIFEHVPPAKVPAIVRGLRRHLTPDGLIFANIPAFGADPVFGTVFETYLEEWRAPQARGVPFTLLHTDEHGFPLHGHITWADTAWWQRQFTDNGFTRRPDLERTAHERYGEAFRRDTPSRAAFYLFQAT